MEKKKRLIGITVLGILAVLGALFQLTGVLDFNAYRFLFQPLPEKIITIHFFIAVIATILLFVSGAGILFLKEVFRKIILCCSIYTLYGYLIEAPFFSFRNLPEWGNQIVAEMIATTPNIPVSTAAAFFWIFIIVGCIIDFGLAVFAIYYFTRSKVKEQFK